MDVLDEILGSLRLTGGVVIDGTFSGDFCVLAQFTPKHFEPFFPEPETLISYHYVRSGQLMIEVEGAPPTLVDAGTIAILPRNDRHTLCSRIGLQPADASEVLWVTSGGVHHVSTGTEGPKSEVWCGFLGAAEGRAHPVLDALPPLLTLDVTSGQAQWLDSSLRFLAHENPSPETVARLAEMFLSQAIGEYVGKLPLSAKGWLRGLADPAVSKALSIIHKRYAEDLDVEMLAREAGVSRSVLGDRFVELLGEPPMRYCASWRMRIAANLLRDGKNSANVAYAVGFSSEAAFNRAFKREFGVPPATWKREAELRDRIAAGDLEAIDPHPNQLVVSATPTTVNWISRHIAEFNDANPDLMIQLDPNPNPVSFEGSDVDCALRFGAAPPDDLAVEELFRLEFTPMCSPEFLGKHPDIKSPDDLRDVPRITPNDPWWAEWWRHFGLERPEGKAPIVDMGAQMLDGAAAVSGRGIALLTPLFWGEELADGRLVRPLPHLLDGGGTYWLFYPKSRAEWSKIRRFSAWLHLLCERSAAEQGKAA
ncbi:MAG: helix-turn-helix domain-containing protein [Sphingomonas sp.]|nr:helix-turn-helix domain-containing protein [Sphingomonas sp.]